MKRDAFDSLVTQAKQFQKAGKTEEAIVRFERAKELDAAHPALCELMEIYIRRERWPAVVQLGIAISLGTWQGVQNGLLSVAEATDVYGKILGVLNLIHDAWAVDSMGSVYWILAKCTLLIDTAFGTLSPV